MKVPLCSSVVEGDTVSRSDREVADFVARQLRAQARQAAWASDPVRWAGDVLGVHLWSKQEEIAQSVVDHKRTVVASCHGTGKALAVHTPIPTPDGEFTPMGDIKPGMKVLGADGRPVTVMASTGIHVAPSFRITLEGPSGIVQVEASGDHVWPVLSGRDVASASVKSRRSGLSFHAGMWTHRIHNITTRDIVNEVSNRRYPVIPPMTHTPEESETPQWIRDLLRIRGTVDSDGRPCVEWNQRHGLPEPDELQELRTQMRAARIQTLKRRTRRAGSDTWTLSIALKDASFMIPPGDDRALARTKAIQEGHPGWRVRAVQPLGEALVQCIQVDAPDNLYLCTEAMIPTHNSMIASVLSCWWISTHPIGEAIVVSTAPSYPQVNKILWEEIRKHHTTASRGDNPMIGRVTQGDEWKANDGRILAFGRKPPSSEQGKHAFQGIHRRYVLVVVDEACGVGEQIWTGAEAITTNVGCRILAIGNPDDRNTEFGNAFLKPEAAQDWNRISVPASSTPNFTGERVPRLLNEVLVSRTWCEERKRSWGEQDPRYISKVLAKFPEQSKSSLFPPSVVAAAFEDVPAQPVGPVLRLGVDVARFGTDRNVVVSYAGKTARVEETWTGTDTVSSAYQVLEIAERLRLKFKSAWVEIRVDAVGLGAGVVDTLNARAALLKEPWYSVYEMHGSASPPVNVGGSVHGYGNARAYWFDQLRQGMRNRSVCIEEHAGLRDDFPIIFYSFKHGKLFIMSKEEMRKLYGRSPDFADALAYAVAPVEDGLPVGSSVSQDAAEAIEDFSGALDESEMSISPF